ncbi:hypothetical protein [Wenjunlia tyrosinilytica]|uniref:Uncharacterized protein n=1 Tax=Wenjunlia tyrosinilytica TaxID=1544741 RepID=A0A917ZVH9_9ACTN|nr:hypothetical protein [Wenjunlia tyrosinilytica]GGO95249.1 hypothetical protein GCM10012280_52000 [Wenjunlia tyrosinilytica]
MPLMLEVSDEVRAEIGDEEADRLLAGENAPESYDCTSCRTPGDIAQERTSTVLFVGEETAVLAFAHATCIPSQVVSVTEEQLLGAVQSITRGEVSDGVHSAPAHDDEPAQPAVLGITCGLVLCQGSGHPALVVEPTGPITRPGSQGTRDEFLTLLIEQGFLPVNDVERPPSPLPGWSVLLAMGKLHAVLQPDAFGGQTSWWQAHQPLQVTEAWRNIASRHNEVFVYAAPSGMIGRQPREDLLREALDRASAQGLLLGASLRLAGT